MLYKKKIVSRFLHLFLLSNSVWMFKNFLIFLIAADEVSHSITISGLYEIKTRT